MLVQVESALGFPGFIPPLRVKGTCIFSGFLVKEMKFYETALC